MMFERLLRWAQPLFVLLASFFIGLLLRSQWAELRAHSWRLAGGWLALSTGFLLVTWMIEVGIWRHLLQLMGGHLPLMVAVRIWFLSAIVRYVPGNIWQPLSMTLYCQRWDIRPEATVASIALYQAVILLAAAPIGVIYFSLSGNLGLLTYLFQGATFWLMGLAVLPVGIFLLRPDWLTAMMNWALARLKRPTLEMHLSSRQLLVLLIVAGADWILWGMTFAALTFALEDYTLAEKIVLIPHLVAVYPIAYAIGFISFVTPSGFGVREGAFFLLLAPLLGGGAATAIALAMRIWTTLGEAVIAFFCVVGERKRLTINRATLAGSVGQELSAINRKSHGTTKPA
jgi:hypothetical protein